MIHLDFPAALAVGMATTFVMTDTEGVSTAVHVMSIVQSEGKFALCSRDPGSFYYVAHGRMIDINNGRLGDQGVRARVGLPRYTWILCEVVGPTRREPCDLARWNVAGSHFPV